MKRWFLLLGAAIPIVCAPLSSGATSCREWNRMSDQRKWDRIDRMIEDAIAGSGGRSTSVNRNSIDRCLRGRSQDIFYEFDDVCSDSSTADMSAIRRSFKHFIWGCVNA